jgi:hypothetical protein
MDSSLYNINSKTLQSKFGTSFNEFLNSKIQNWFPIFFLSTIDETYKRKLVKRLYSFYIEKVKPLLNKFK